MKLHVDYQMCTIIRMGLNATISSCIRFQCCSEIIQTNQWLLIHVSQLSTSFATCFHTTILPYRPYGSTLTITIKTQLWDMWNVFASFLQKMLLFRVTLYPKQQSQEQGFSCTIYQMSGNIAAKKKTKDTMFVLGNKSETRLSHR